MAPRTARAIVAISLGLALLGALIVASRPRAHAGDAPPLSRVDPQRPAPAASVDAPPPAPGPPPRLRGHILDADGNPVVGAQVRALAPGGPPAVRAEATTGNDGAFAIARLDLARAIVEADRAPQGAVRSAELAVPDGATTDVTLVLAPAGVGGTVVDAAGHPVAGASLSIEGVPWSVSGTTSDGQGAFRFGAVPFEAVAVVAVAAGYKSARAALGAREGGPEPVLRIALDAGGPVEGDALDPDGKPIHARIVACEGQPTEARTESADDGTFRLPPSAIGCDAVALHDEYAPSDPSPVQEGRRTELRLGAGGGIAGTVVDERGTRFDAFAVGVESFVGAHGAGRRIAGRSFDNGVFRLDRLVPGTYVLTASAPGRPPTRSDPIDVRGGAVTDGVRIVLATGGVVTGRVLDDRGAPVAGVELRFDLVSAVAESGASARSDDLGRYRLEGAPAGPLTVQARRDGFRTKLVSGLRVDSGRTLVHDIVMSPVDGGGGLELGGIGATIVPAGAGAAFGSIFPGDPADRAGLRPGDRLVRLDGDDATAMSVADAIQRLRGEVGTSVGVSVQRGEGQAAQTVDVVIVRATVVH